MLSERVVIVDHAKITIRIRAFEVFAAWTEMSRLASAIAQTALAVSARGPSGRALGVCAASPFFGARRAGRVAGSTANAGCAFGTVPTVAGFSAASADFRSVIARAVIGRTGAAAGGTAKFARRGPSGFERSVS